jgi:hypothetical protein
MIIFIDEDEAYLAWLAAHRRGFVVNSHHPPTSRYLMLHRAGCADIAASKKHGWTTGPYIKLCAGTVRELEDWARRDVRGALRVCPRCRPRLAGAASQETRLGAKTPVCARLTKLGDHLLSFVLDVAVMSLDGMTRYSDDPPTVCSLAAYVGKTVHQIEPALRRLIEDDLISVNGDTRADVRLTTRSIIYPTALSLQTIPAFTTMPAQELDRAIASLSCD